MHAQKTAADIGLNPTVLFGNTVATALRNGTSKLRACTRVVAPLSGNRAGTDSLIPQGRVFLTEDLTGPGKVSFGPYRTLLMRFLQYFTSKVQN